jgi:hypothetical protein
MAASPRRNAAAPTAASNGSVNAGASPDGRAALAASRGGSAGDVGIGGAAAGAKSWPAPAPAAGGETWLAVGGRAASAAGCGATAAMGERSNREAAGDGGRTEEATRGGPAWGPPGRVAS